MTHPSSAHSSSAHSSPGSAGPKSGIKLRIRRSRPSEQTVRNKPPRQPRKPGRWKSGRWKVDLRKHRILFAVLGLITLAVLTVGHIFYWYLPRLRPASPRPGHMPAQLLASDAFPYAVWLPFPHQNLALLEKVEVESVSAAGDIPLALSRLAGMPEPSLPSFGTFRLPPSREITLATDETGERFALAAEVYPMVAAFAKLAGRLANNRWLQGGELTVDGRPVQVTWYGRVWTVTSSGFPDLTAPPLEPAFESGPLSLLIAEVRQPRAPFPRGRFHLNRDGDDIVLASSGGVPDVFDLEVAKLSEMGAFLLLISGARAEPPEPMQAMTFFTREDPLEFSRGGVSYEFPGMASIYRTEGGERWSLPGETLLKWTGRKVRRLDLGGGFEVAAIDKRSLRRIEKLVPQFIPLVRPRPEGRLTWGLWFDLEEGQIEVSRIARAMREIPIVSLESEERWRDAAAVLEPAARMFSDVSVVVTENPSAFELRFVGRR